MAAAALSPERIRRYAGTARIPTLGAIVLVPLLLQLPFLGEPLFGDEGVYATVGREMLRGAVPYRDLFDHKPPLLYLWYALSFALGGENAEAPRLAMALAMSATAWLVYIEGRLLYSQRVGLAGGAVFAAMSGLVILHGESSSELLMNLPLTAAVVAATKGLRTGSVRWWGAAGILMGIAIMTKPVAGWAGLALAAMLLAWIATAPAQRRRSEAYTALAASISLAGGALAVVAVVAAPFFLLGAGGAFVDANIVYNLDFGARMTFSFRLEQLGTALLFLTFVASPLLLGTALGTVAIVTRRRRSDLVLLAWMAGSILGIASTGTFHMHHFVQLVPPAAILTVVGIAALLQPVGTRARRLGRVAGMGLLAIFAIGAAVTNAPAYFARTAPERHLERQLLKSLRGEAENANVVISEHVRQLTADGDTVYVHADGSLYAAVYFYSGRSPATTIFYGTPLRVRPEPGLAPVIEELRASLPALIVDATGLLDGVNDEPIEAWQEQFRPPALLALIEERYEFVETVASVDLYRLRAP